MLLQFLSSSEFAPAVGFARLAVVATGAGFHWSNLGAAALQKLRDSNRGLTETQRHVTQASLEGSINGPCRLPASLECQPYNPCSVDYQSLTLQ